MGKFFNFVNEKGTLKIISMCFLIETCFQLLKKRYINQSKFSRQQTFIQSLFFHVDSRLVVLSKSILNLIFYYCKIYAL